GREERDEDLVGRGLDGDDIVDDLGLHPPDVLAAVVEEAELLELAADADAQVAPGAAGDGRGVVLEDGVPGDVPGEQGEVGEGAAGEGEPEVLGEPGGEGGVLRGGVGGVGGGGRGGGGAGAPEPRGDGREGDDEPGVVAHEVVGGLLDEEVDRHEGGPASAAGEVGGEDAPPRCG